MKGVSGARAPMEWPHEPVQNVPQAGNVDQGRVAPGPSARSDGGSVSWFKFLFAVAALFDVAGAAAATGPGSRHPPEDPALRLLSQLVRSAREAGAADQAWLGERHGEPENLDIVRAAWHGALSSGLGEATLYREGDKNNAGKEKEIGRALRDPSKRARFAAPFANVIARGTTSRAPKTPEETAAAERFASVVKHPNATIEFLVFYNKDMPSLSRVVKDARFALVSVGYRHAESEFAGEDYVRDPVTGLVGQIPEPGYLVSKIGVARQKEMFAGLKQSREAGHSPLYIASSGVQQRRRVPSPENRQAFLGHQLDEGRIVVELLSDQGFNITVVMEADPDGRALAEALELAQRNPGRVFVFHTGPQPSVQADAAPQPKAHGEL